jgi:Type II restriction endonuclease EcoO109I
MTRLSYDEVRQYIEEHIGEFHEARLKSLEKLQLRHVLKAKNPYLFRAKNIHTGHDLVKTLLDAYLSAQEEGIFGGFLERLAVFVCGRVFGGGKSSGEGIDLEFERDGTHYLVIIKSGPNWGNSGQIENMKTTFRKAIRILRTNNPKIRVQVVNGCCYGKDNNPDKGDYMKLCGQRFWEFISGDEKLYLEIIEPLGRRAKERNEEFQRLYAQRINKFDIEVLQDFVKDDLIDWEKLVRFNSGVDRVDLAPKPKGG